MTFPLFGNPRFYFALRYRPGTELARNSPPSRGRYKTRAEAEALRDACMHADQIEVVDLTPTTPPRVRNRRTR